MSDTSPKPPMRHSLASRMANARRLTARAAEAEPDYAADQLSAATAPQPPSAPTPMNNPYAGRTPGDWHTKQLIGVTDRGWALFWTDGQRTRRLDEAGEFQAADARLLADAPWLLREHDRLKRDVEALQVALTLALHKCQKVISNNQGGYVGDKVLVKEVIAIAKAALAQTEATR